MIRLGVCAPPDKSQLIAEAGFEYIECALSAIAAMDNDEYEAARRAVIESPIRAEAFNIMLPASEKIVGPDAIAINISKYLEFALPRAAAMGCEVVVFGSGGARAVPAGYSVPDAYEDIAEFLQMAADRCSSFGIIIAIEPLNKSECNIINSVPEAIRTANRVNRRSVKVLADSYHMSKENQSPFDIREAGDLMAHTHISRPDRGYPFPGDGYEDEYARFYDALRDIDYNGRMSVEGNTVDFNVEIVKAYNALELHRNYM